MYLYTSKSTKSFLELFNKYNNKIKYLKEIDLTEEQKAKIKFRVYKINSNTDLTQKEYQYDNTDIKRYLDDEDIVQDKNLFNLENDAVLYITKNFNYCSEYIFLITKELNTDIKTIVDVEGNETLLSSKKINPFRKQYIIAKAQKENAKYYPIKSINFNEMLKNALIISKEQGSSKLELTLKYETTSIKRIYLLIQNT